MKPSDYIRQRRKALGISQAELANRLSHYGHDTVKTSVGHWERDRNNPPIEEETFRLALALALEVDINEMMQQMGFILTKDDLSDDAVLAAMIIERLPDDGRQLAIEYLHMLDKKFASNP